MIMAPRLMVKAMFHGWDINLVFSKGKTINTIRETKNE